MSSCNSIAGLYFEGTCDVISYQSNAQGAQKRPINFTFCPRRVLAQRPKPEEALIGPPAYKECEILV